MKAGKLRWGSKKEEAIGGWRCMVISKESNGEYIDGFWITRCRSCSMHPVRID